MSGGYRSWLLFAVGVSLLASILVGCTVSVVPGALGTGISIAALAFLLFGIGTRHSGCDTKGSGCDPGSECLTVSPCLTFSTPFVTPTPTTGPCLTPAPTTGPCLAPPLETPTPTTGPCLDVGPCLAPPLVTPTPIFEVCLSLPLPTAVPAETPTPKPSAGQSASNEAARSEVIERVLARGILPEDVAERLHDRRRRG